MPFQHENTPTLAWVVLATIVILIIIISSGKNKDEET